MQKLRFSLASALGAILFAAVSFAALREADEIWDSWLFSLTLGLLLSGVLLAAHRTGHRRAFWIGYALFGWGYLSLALIPSTESRLIFTKALTHLHQSRVFFVRAYRMRAILAPDRMRNHDVSRNDLMRALTPTRVMFKDSTRYDDYWEVEENDVALPAQLGYHPLSWGTRYNKPEQFENIILKASPDGDILRIKDVAKVEMDSPFYAPRGLETAEGFVRIGHSLSALLAAWLGGLLSRRLCRVSVATG